MSVTDYVDRTADMLAFQGTVPGEEVLLIQELVVPEHPGGSLVTGILKLSQVYVLLLLEDVDSRKYGPIRGTNFLRDARFGGWRTPLDVKQSFYSANLDVKRQLQLAQPIGTPDDERLFSADAINVILSQDQVGLTIKLTSVAGDARTFIVPLPVPIRK